MEIRCLLCGSKNVQVQLVTDKSFSVKKGFLGTLLFGGTGAVMGINGKKKEKKVYVCQACGKTNTTTLSEDQCQKISDALQANNTISLEILKVLYPNIEWTPQTSTPIQTQTPPPTKPTYAPDESSQKITADRFPKGITRIERETFQEMGIHYRMLKKITEVVLPESVTSIAPKTFQSSRLEKITFSNNITDIGTQAFWSCSNLMSVNLPQNLETIGDMAFAFFPGNSITIPANVKSIHMGAFQGSNIVFIRNYSDLVFTIGEYNKHGDIAEKALCIVDKFGNYTFAKKNGKSYQLFENHYLGIEKKDNITVTHYIGDDTTLTMPAQINGLNVYYEFKASSPTIVWPNSDYHSTINENALKIQKTVKRLIIPKTVKRIEAGAINLSLEKIEFIYLGTKAEWHAIGKANHWCFCGSETETIQCSDGCLPLEDS